MHIVVLIFLYGTSYSITYYQSIPGESTEYLRQVANVSHIMIWYVIHYKYVCTVPVTLNSLRIVGVSIEYLTHNMYYIRLVTNIVMSVWK